MSLGLKIYQNSSTEQTQLAILCQAWGKGFWSKAEIEQALAVPGTFLYYLDRDNGVWQGCVFGRRIGEFCEIFYIFVGPTQRGCGVGRALLDGLVAMVRQEPQIEKLSLEVRESNLDAIHLYESVGFKRGYTRRGYYPDGEDALVYFKVVR